MSDSSLISCGFGKFLFPSFSKLCPVTEKYLGITVNQNATLKNNVDIACLRHTWKRYVKNKLLHTSKL